MRGYRWVWMLGVVLLGGAVGRLHAEVIGCVSTTFRVLGANDKICVSAFDDPKVPGVTCHLSQARTGGMKGTVGVAEDRSRFAIACRQVGPITVDLTKLPKEVVYLYRAGNSVARKSGTIPPYHDHVRGTLPWYRTSFSTS